MDGDASESVNGARRLRGAFTLGVGRRCALRGVERVAVADRCGSGRSRVEVCGVSREIEMPVVAVAFETRQSTQRCVGRVGRADESVNDAADRESVADEQHGAVRCGCDVAGRLPAPPRRFVVALGVFGAEVRLVIETKRLELVG
jgi:hypothetical protein